MSHPNQHTTKPDRAKMRAWQKKANALLDAKDKAEEDILVAMHEMLMDGLSQAAVAGMFAISPSSVAFKAAKGEQIAAGRGADRVRA